MLQRNDFFHRIVPQQKVNVFNCGLCPKSRQNRIVLYLRLEIRKKWISAPLSWKRERPTASLRLDGYVLASMRSEVTD